ncbi:helix-turn-helix domain-containing protein [Blautia sp. HCP28S3_G10]|uniref:helix-turn-helix domain-containing protein n=1 Tax=Blautia sp. HCP28S3_G10 TaxID=3438908 RepID=UPI002A849E95|nr:helix-turn-helix transcriptional regulator [Schaedlerella sp.]
MAVSYKKLFKMLIDRDMKKKTLCEKAKVSQGTISRMAKDEPVSMEIVAKICLALDCTLDDIVEIIPDEED